MATPPNPLGGITLRDYRPADTAAMYALDIECFPPPFRFTSRAMRRFAEEDKAIVVLAETDNLPPHLAGFAIAHLEGQTAYIVTLDVAAFFRRRGVARRLMVEIESRARGAGAQDVALHVFTGNSGAIAFYESLGYDRLRMAENFYARAAHAFVYRKTLASEDA